MSEVTENPERLFDHDKKAVSGSYATPDIGENLDTVWDQVQQAYSEGGLHAVEKYIAKRAEEEIAERVGEALATMLSYVITSNNPRFAADIAALACGLHSRTDTLPAHVARSYGYSRTYVCSEIRKFCELVGLPVKITLRSETDDLGNTHANNHRNVKRTL